MPGEVGWEADMGEGLSGWFGFTQGDLSLEVLIRTCFCWGFLESLKELFPCQPGDVVVVLPPFLVRS